MRNLLSKKNKFACCLENDQKYFPLKFQWDGSSNSFIKVIATHVEEYIDFSPLNDAFEIDAKLSYDNQSISSRMGMAKYDIVLNEGNTLDDKVIL